MLITVYFVFSPYVGGYVLYIFYFLFLYFIFFLAFLLCCNKIVFTLLFFIGSYIVVVGANCVPPRFACLVLLLCIALGLSFRLGFQVKFWFGPWTLFYYFWASWRLPC